MSSTHKCKSSNLTLTTVNYIHTLIFSTQLTFEPFLDTRFKTVYNILVNSLHNAKSSLSQIFSKSFSVSGGPSKLTKSSIDNGAHGIEKLLQKIQIKLLSGNKPISCALRKLQ